MTAPDPSTPYDLFVSHATADDAIVSQIADRLKAAGLRAWIDHERGITYGDNWDRAIHDAANACTAGLFILSPASTKSEYCIAEWNRILALGKRLYIAMITPVPVPDIPLRLGTIQYADLTRDRDGVLPTLIEAIVAQRGLDPNDANVGQARAIAGSFPRWQLDLPLIGREADLKQVRDLLAGPNRAVVILGLGGVGKTRLAAEIAATADPAQFRDGVLWHTITDAPSDFATLTGLIRDHLGLDKTTEDGAIWRALDRRAALLVLDNAEACKAPALYADRLNRIDLSGGTRVLMTSRAEWREARSQKRHDLHAPSPEAAVKILQAMVEAEPPAFMLDGHAPAIAKAARYHPRLLQYAVHWLNDRPPDAVERALTTLKGTDAQEALQEMILKTVEQAWAQPGGEEAIRALRRLAVCWGGFIFEAAEAIVGAGFDARQIALLKQWGLLAAENNRYDMDPLVAAALGEDPDAIPAHYDYYRALANRHNER